MFLRNPLHPVDNPNYLSLSIVTHDTEYAGTPIVLEEFGDTYYPYEFSWTKNPYTLSTWTVDEANALTAGFRGLVLPFGEIRVTPHYVVVEEIPEHVIPEAPLGTIALVVSMFLAFGAATLYRRGRIKL